MTSPYSVLLAVIIVATPCPVFAAVGSFRPIGLLPDGTISRALDVSADGLVVSGDGSSPSQSGAIRWTREDGIELLSSTSGFLLSNGTGISSDGSTIVGGGRSEDGSEAFKWTDEAGPIGLGELPGGEFFSAARDVSGDGGVVTGLTEVQTQPRILRVAFRWTAESGMRSIGRLPGATASSSAFGISRDGSTIVGQSSSRDADSVEAFRWTQTRGMQALGFLGTSFLSSNARAASADGTVVVGHSSTDYGSQAFQWTEDTGMQSLGFLAEEGEHQSVATGISDDGSTIVGWASLDSTRTAILWSQATGMVRVVDLLSNLGVDIEQWELRDATAVSADGQVIVGTGVNPDGANEGWIVDLSEITPAGDYDRDGDVDLDDYEKWKRDYGREVPNGFGADGNSNGVIDAPDYSIWRDAHETASFSIPEPTPLILASLAGATLAIALYADGRKAREG